MRSELSEHIRAERERYARCLCELKHSVSRADDFEVGTWLLVVKLDSDFFGDRLAYGGGVMEALEVGNGASTAFGDLEVQNDVGPTGVGQVGQHRHVWMAEVEDVEAVLGQGRSYGLGDGRKIQPRGDGDGQAGGIPSLAAKFHELPHAGDGNGAAGAF